MEEIIRAVQAMQDYIDNNISEKITLSDLSEAANYSPWYCARIFKELTGYSPADYIRRLRLTCSALKMRDGNIKVIDAAFDANFSSVDGYQRAFRREFGCNPKQYSDCPTPIPLFTVYGVKFKSLFKEVKNMTQTQSVFIQITDKKAHKVIVKRGVKAREYMEYCEEVGCDVWGVLTSIKSLSGEPVCLWLPEKYRKNGTSEYVQGVEVPLDYNGVIPEGFDVIEFPDQKYLMFQGEPFDEEMYCEAITAVEQAIDKYDPSVIGYEWDDENPRIQLEPRGERGYIELKAVKKVK